MGLDMRTPFFEQMERELIAKLNNPKTRYLDLYISAFDHVAHHNRDHQSHMATMQDIDRVIGRIWSAIQKSPLVRGNGADTRFRSWVQHGRERFTVRVTTW